VPCVDVPVEEPSHSVIRRLAALDYAAAKAAIDCDTRTVDPT
jgi:hypothetical protein